MAPGFSPSMGYIDDNVGCLSCIALTHLKIFFAQSTDSIGSFLPLLLNDERAKPRAGIEVKNTVFLYFKFNDRIISAFKVEVSPEPEQNTLSTALKYL